ncbi:Oligopeptide transport ATP-binding protein OppD [Bifidobacterium ramosum]|nr:ABC transporter ATP-binding protein [Bifidobacterium ramosum]KAB8287757.1 Oligopeptide transport ATP-binding protein OppD [Bifidobacterium ramosum]
MSDNHDDGVLLDVRNLNVSYGGNPAVIGMNLTVRAGQITGLIGESGSGKSTIGMAAMGLLPGYARVEADRFTVAGRDVLGLSDAEWRPLRGAVVSMVFQEPLSALNPTMTIGRQIALALRNHHTVPADAVRDETIALLRKVRLPDPERRIGQYPHQLSGGQLQRVVIAMALAGRPELLIADEPTTALDVTVQARILELFRAIADDTGIGILFISHDLGVISRIADRVTVMLNGVAVQSGPTNDVLHGRQHPYTKALLAALPGSVPPRQPLRVLPDFLTRGENQS